MSHSGTAEFEQRYRQVIECYCPDDRNQLAELLPLLEALPAHARDEISEIVRRAAGRLPPLVQSIEAYPIAPEYERWGRRERNVNSLIETLSHHDWLPVDFSMPTGAILGRALILARINFLRALDYSMELGRNENAARFRSVLQDMIDNAIFTRLAEELLDNTVSNPRNVPAIRKAASHKLLSLWSNWVHHPVADFPSVVLSAWKARRKVKTIYGSMFGIQEMLALIREECESDFVSYFTRDQVTADETDAFREFLFGIPHEELRELQDYMRTSGVNVLTREEVHRIVRKTLPPLPSEDPSAEEVFASYWRRRVRAEYRTLSSLPGPQKTAEGFMIEHILRQSSRDQE